MNQLNVYDAATAAALRVVLHCEVAPKNYRADDSGDETPTWFIRSHVPAASKLLQQRKIGTLPADSPFRAALFAAATAERILTLSPTVLEWMPNGAFIETGRNGGGWRPQETPAAMLIPLLSTAAMARVERDAITATLAAKAPFPALPLHIAAAAITCGCVPVGMSGTAQQPFLHVAEESIATPGLRLADMIKATGDGIDATALPGYPIGEHPFLYAFEAVKTAALYRHVMEQTRKNTTHMFRAKSVRQRTAVVSESLLKDKRGGSFRDHLRKHLAGV